MSRYKDLLNTTLLRKEYPCAVEIPLPPMGFCFRLNLIEQWLTDYLENRDYGRWSTRCEKQDFAVWAFRDEVTAAAFRANVEMILKLSDKQVLNRLAKRGY